MPVLIAGTKKVLYIHVPKTGGSWVEDLMRSYGPVSGVRFGDAFGGLPCSPQHFHAPLLEHIYSTDRWAVENTFDFVFMTVRDPVPRLQSEFRYRVVASRPVRLAQRMGLAADFGRWARRALARARRDPFALDNHLRPQTEFQAFGAHVFRVEDGLDRITVALDELTGSKGTPPAQPVNRSKSTFRARYSLSPQLRDRIGDYYARDYELFGYEPMDNRSA